MQWHEKRRQLLEEKANAENERDKIREEKDAELGKEKEIANELRKRNEYLEKEIVRLQEAHASMTIQIVAMGDEVERSHKALESVREKLRRKEARILELCLQSIEDGPSGSSSLSMITSSHSPYEVIGRSTSAFFQRLLRK